MSTPAMSSTPMSLKAFCTLSPHNPMSFDNRHDAAEQVRAELDHQRRRLDPLSTRLDVFTLVALGLGQRGVVVLQRDSAEGDLPGLVLHDVGQHLLGQRSCADMSRSTPKAASASPSM